MKVVLPRKIDFNEYKKNRKNEKIFPKKILDKKNDTIKKAKPFLKWVGGKKQLLKEISKYYPFNNKEITKYAEPFIGGGAVLFDILNKFDLKEVYISDINLELINTYIVIKNYVNELIFILDRFQREYLSLEEKDRKMYYLEKRKKFNNLTLTREDDIKVEKAALMIFLNKTCFNGLFRVNKQGLFNVPMGAYKNPIICDEENIKEVSKKLQKVKIVCADYKNSLNFIDKNTFVYIDPPYRPISSTSNFTSYTSNAFDDEKQRELAKFIDDIDKKGAKIVISNSDPKNVKNNDNFFDELYSKYKIQRVEANRMINSNKIGRGKINELLITNF